MSNINSYRINDIKNKNVNSNRKQTKNRSLKIYN